MKNDFEATRREGDTDATLRSGLSLVDIYLALDKIDSAYLLLTNVKQLDGEKNERFWLTMAKVLEKQNDTRAALIAIKKAVSIRDSTRLTTEASKMQPLNAVYELEVMGENIDKLTQDVIDKQSQIQLQVMVFSLSVLMLSILVLVYYRFNKRNKTQLSIIERQKEEMALQNAALQQTLDKLSNTQDQLIESAKMSSLGQMTAGLAHEINNPLNFISGGVQALDHNIKSLCEISKKVDPIKTGEIEQDIYSTLSNINNGVNRTARIIKSLRTFASPQLVFTNINVIEPLEMAIDILEKKIKDEKISLHRNYAPQQRPVFGNLTELSQVFGNLIDNAIHAMEHSERKELFISVETQSNLLAVKITDTGCGIPLENNDKILEPFFTTKNTGKGTGLGLSISYGIIKNHKGSLIFVSEVNKGTEFTVLLPFATASTRAS